MLPVLNLYVTSTVIQIGRNTNLQTYTCAGSPTSNLKPILRVSIRTKGFEPLPDHPKDLCTLITPYPDKRE